MKNTAQETSLKIIESQKKRLIPIYEFILFDCNLAIDRIAFNIEGVAELILSSPTSSIEYEILKKLDSKVDVKKVQVIDDTVTIICILKLTPTQEKMWSKVKIETDVKCSFK